MQKTLIAASLMLITGMANAAVTNGSLSFNWQGTTPAAPVVASGWKFTDAVGADFTPSSAALNFATNTDGTLAINSANNIDFFVTAENGTLNSLGAYLGSAPVSSGFIASKQLALASSATPGSDEVAVLLNNQALSVGSGSSTTITGVSGKTNTPVSLGLAAKVSASNFSEKTVVGFTVPVIFAVDVTATTP